MARIRERECGPFVPEGTRAGYWGTSVLNSNLRVVGALSMRELMRSKEQQDTSTTREIEALNLQSAANVPLAKLALEADALGDPQGRDDAPLDFLAGFR